MIVNDELERMLNEAVVAYLRCWQTSACRHWEKPHKYLSQHGLLPGRYSNSSLFEYEAKMLSTKQQYSLIHTEAVMIDL